MSSTNYLKGIFLVALASVSWGALGTSAQYLFQVENFLPLNLSSLRLLSAGVLMVLLCFCMRTKNMLCVFKSVRDAFEIFFNGSVLFLAHTAFFFSIYYSNAGTGAIFLATQSLFAAIYLTVVEKRPLTKDIILCIVLAILGVLLIVTNGNFRILQFSPLSVLWGLVSVISATTYTLQPRAVIQRVGVLPVASWGILFGGILGCIINQSWLISFNWSLPAISNFSFIVIVGTILAFWWFLSSLKYLSPVIICIVVTLEPLTAFLFSCLFLNETVGFFQILGIGSVLSTVFILALWKK